MIVDINIALMALALITPRAFVCLAILPGFGTRSLTGFARSAVCIGLALPAVVPTFFALKQASLDPALLAVLAFKEAAIGAALGVMLALPIWAVQSVGALFDNQRTTVQVQNSNASLDQDASATGGLLINALIMVMVEAGLYLNFCRVLLDSYAGWPASTLVSPMLDLPTAELMLRFGQFMSHIVIYSVPVLLPLLLVDAAFGVFSVAAPNLQLTTAANPIKCLVGLVVLLLYWPTLAYHAGNDFARQLDLIAILFGQLPVPR